MPRIVPYDPKSSKHVLLRVIAEQTRQLQQFRVQVKELTSVNKSLRARLQWTETADYRRSYASEIANRHPYK